MWQYKQSYIAITTKFNNTTASFKHSLTLFLYKLKQQKHNVFQNSHKKSPDFAKRFLKSAGTIETLASLSVDIIVNKSSQ
jgi:hypothetical protein